MRKFDYILLACGGLVVIEGAMIITLNTKRGYWEPTNKFHLLSVVLYLIYLTVVIFSSVESATSSQECDLLWKICSTLYIAVTMSVYSFYYVKSRLVNSVQWTGKKWSGRIVLIMIVMMGVLGLCFFWPPIKDVQYNGILINGVCRLVNRRWIAILWVGGDSVLSVMLLALFIKPLKKLKKQFGVSSSSVAMFRSMERMTKKNRNLLCITVTVTIGVYTAIAVIGDLSMRTVIYMCAIDRLVTLQCITMTFSYDEREYFYCHACFILFLKKRQQESVEEEKSHSVEIYPRNSVSTSIVFMSSLVEETRSEEVEAN
jgi:hypothetical protein